jgi:hypothetical protein
MTTVSETIEPTRQECPNRCDLEDRFYINEPTAWVTCIVTSPGDNLVMPFRFKGNVKHAIRV